MYGLLPAAIVDAARKTLTQCSSWLSHVYLRESNPGSEELEFETKHKSDATAMSKKDTPSGGNVYRSAVQAAPPSSHENPQKVPLEKFLNQRLTKSIQQSTWQTPSVGGTIKKCSLLDHALRPSKNAVQVQLFLSLCPSL